MVFLLASSFDAALATRDLLMCTAIVRQPRRLDRLGRRPAGPCLQRVDLVGSGCAFEIGRSKIVFNPKRPIPEPPGRRCAIPESLLKAPAWLHDEPAQQLLQKGWRQDRTRHRPLSLGRAAAHWSNYDETEMGKYTLPIRSC